jgi:hypothetical protein
MMRDQLISERFVKSKGVGVGCSAQVAKRNSGTQRALGGSRPAVVTHDNDDPSRQRPISTRVKNSLQDGAAVGCENSNIHRMRITEAWFGKSHFNVEQVSFLASSDLDDAAIPR